LKTGNRLKKKETNEKQMCESNKIHTLVLRTTSYKNNPGLINFAKNRYSKLLEKDIIYVCQLLCEDVMIIGKVINNEVVWSESNYEDCEGCED